MFQAWGKEESAVSRPYVPWSQVLSLVLDPWTQHKHAIKGHSLPKRLHNLECNSAINRCNKPDRQGKHKDGMNQLCSVWKQWSGKQPSNSCVYESFVVFFLLAWQRRILDRDLKVDSEHGCVDIYRMLLLCIRSKRSTFSYMFLQFIFGDKKIWLF